MKIAFFDYVITHSNGIGKCDMAILEGLCHEHEFTVFAVQFENPCPDRIRWVHIPAFNRPLALLYLTFHLLAPLYYLWHCLRHRVRFDSVQFIESNLCFGNIAYAHFCHRAFLKHYWKDTGMRGLRRIFRWLDHWLHAQFEPWAFRRVSQIVVPSRGLARELTDAYPYASSKLRIVANPIDLGRLQPPADFDREAFRKAAGLGLQDVVLVFVALGHYERKGLPLLLDALAEIAAPEVKVLVVGGSNAAVASYRERAKKIGLNGSVRFVGTQREIRPYLWAADALILPSHYEVFPLVALEAAGAGLPVLATPLYGVEEFLRDGENGFVMQRNVAAVTECIARFAQAPMAARRNMGRHAQSDARRYDVPEFVSVWSRVYAEAAFHDV